MKKYYRLDPNKIKNFSLNRLSFLPVEYFIQNPVWFPEDFEYFDDIKYLLLIPEERKSLDEIQKDFENKIDILVEQTKSKYERLKQKLENRKLTTSTISTIKLISCDNATISWSKIEQPSTITINSEKSVGYYTFDNFLNFGLNKKPNRFRRIFAKIFLGMEWKDK